MGQHMTRLPVASWWARTRFRPLTEKVPKALLLVDGKPFLDYQLASLREHNLCDIIAALDFWAKEYRKSLAVGKGTGSVSATLATGPSTNLACQIGG
jgi:dTDP-glucose pyrophosphorylase